MVRLEDALKPRAVFVLRCEPRVLALRLKEKGYRPSKIMSNLWAEILDYSLQEALSVYPPSLIHEIDTTRRGLEEVVREALDVLRGRVNPAYGRFNWLKKLEKEGLIGKISAVRPQKALKLLLEAQSREA